MPNLYNGCILGADFFRLFNVVLTARDNSIEVDGYNGKVHVDVASVGFDVGNIGLKLPTREQIDQLNKLLDDLIPYEDGELGFTNLCEHFIDVGDAQHIRQRCYPVSPAVEKEMHKEVDALLKKGVIKPSKSEWASPVVMVRREVVDENHKPITKWRMCIDYRKLNKVSKGDAFPIPNMDQMLNKLQEARYISTLDLSQAFNQIPVAEQCRHLTAFVVPGKGIFEYVRMPFGLKGAPATFQRAMQMIITPEMAPNVMAYIDDIVIATLTWEQHLHWLKVVIDRLNKANFTINRSKSFFGKTEVKYLGFLIDENGTQPDPDKTKPIFEYTVPKIKRQVQRFLGMTSWYRKFIPVFATIAEPLTNLTRIVPFK